MNASPLLFALLPFYALLVLIDQSNESQSKSKAISPKFQQGPNEQTKCLDCHSDLMESQVQHSPAAESCENCHQVNLREHTENGARGLMLAVKVPDLCFNCHKDIKTGLDTLKNVHQAVTIEKRCANCHSPHSSDEKGLLVSQQKKLCLSCHNKDVSASGTKVVNIKKLLTNSKVIHPPVERGGCVVCHQPHGSVNNYLLISAFPKGNYAPAVRDTFALCWECHDSDLLEVATTTTATNFRNGDRNLHFVHVNGKKGKSCIMCHNVHASMNEHLIEDKVPFGEWDLPIKFTSKENGGSCFPGCHAEKSYTR